MSNYTKSTNFATKDNLSPGNPLKIVKGTEIDTEFNNIATAVATKTDNASAAITGGTITGITDLAVADGGTGASTAAGGLNNLLPSQTSNANKYLQTDGTNASWDAVSLSTADITGTLPVANGGTGVTTSTGTTNVVLSNSPTLVTPNLGTPSALVGTNITGTASGLTAGNVTTNANLTGGVTSVGNAATVVTNANLTGAVTSVGNATSLGSFTSANLLAALTDETGTGSAVFATSPTLITPALGTPSALVGTNITGTASGLTAGNVTTNANLTGAVTSVGNATSLGSFSSANLLGALTDETGTGSAVFATSPTLVTPILGTPTSATLTNATGLPVATGVSGLGTGVATALAVNVGSAGAPLVNGGVLGTPTSGTATNLTGLPLSTGVTGTLPVANGGTGTATPSIVAGTNVTVTGTWPNQTIASTAGGSGTVTSVAATVPSVFSISGSPITTSGTLAMTYSGTALPVVNGGTGQTSYTDGQLLIGNTTGNTLTKTTLTAGSGITITNGSGAITIASSGGSGDVVGPASSTDNAVARFDSTTGKLIQNSTGILTDAGAISGLTEITASGLVRTSGSGFQSGNATDSFSKFIHDGGNAALDITNEYNSGGAGSTYGQIVFKNYNSNGGTLTERARISGSGSLLIGTTSSPSSSGVGSGFVLDSDGRASLIMRTNTTSARNLCDFGNPNGSIGSIGVSATTTSYNTSSDYRLKEDVQAMTGALAKVAQLKPVTYKWKADGSNGQGFIAHELDEVVPDCVTGEKDAIDIDGKPIHQGVDISFLVATLTAAIQEQQAMIASLKARLDAANL